MEKPVHEFFDSIACFDKSYVTATVSLLGVKRDSENVLVNAKLILGFHRAPPPLEKLENKYLIAGSWQLDKPLAAAKEFISEFSTGKLNTPLGTIALSTGEHTKPYYSHRPFYQPHQQPQARVSALSVEFGNTTPPIPPQPNADWALKASAPPFDTLSELAVLLDIKTDMNRPQFEIIAACPAAIDASSCIVGTKATVKINAANELDKTDISLGFRTLNIINAVTKRSQIAIDKDSWHREKERASAEIEIDVATGSVLQCYLIVKGICIHYWWVTDKTVAPNYRQAIYELFDPSLTVLTSQSIQNDVKRADAREFESALSHLLWIHGFNVVNFGRNKKTQEGADVIAETPSGRITIIECTTGILKSDKISQLIARTDQLRSQIKKTGINNPTILPVLATTKSYSEIYQDINDAHRKGVAVLSKEDLERLLSDAFIPNQAEKLYDETLSSIAIHRTRN